MKNCKDKNQKMKNQKNLRVDRMTLGYGNKNLRVPRINIPKMNTRNGDEKGDTVNPRRERLKMI